MTDIFIYSDDKKYLITCKLCNLTLEKSKINEPDFIHICKLLPKKSKTNIMIKDGNMFHLYSSKNQKV